MATSLTADAQFAPDSSLEEGVTSELVSETQKFPASREITRNVALLALRTAIAGQNSLFVSMACETIPYASEQGIYFVVAGN